MSIITAPTYAVPLRTGDVILGTEDAAVGELRDSSQYLDNPVELRSRMAEDGYLLIRGFHDREDVMVARREVVSRLNDLGYLKPGTDPMDAVGYSRQEADAQFAKRIEAAQNAPEASEDAIRILNQSARFMPDQLASGNEPLSHILYGERTMSFFEDFFGEPAKHFDFTWFRSIPPASDGTPPHTDVIFMGRAEREQLFTVWTPMGDVDFKQGGLIVLEGSHKNEALRAGYSSKDADTYCVNRDDQRDFHEKARDDDQDGRIASDALGVQRVIGGRWLTSEFSAGDVIVFSVFTVHGSLNNGSDRIRLSSDSRYQPASKEADERWIGAKPKGGLLKRGLIC